MGTREVYEQKLRNGNLYHEPTINPGLGSPRCPRCLSLVDPQAGNGEWTITPVLHDTTAVAGSGLGALLSAVHGINTGIPFIQNRVRGPKWLPFVVGLPPLLLFSGASAAFGEIIILGVLKAFLKSLIYEGHPHKHHSHTSIFVIAYFTGYVCISSVRKTAECLKSLAFFKLLILLITPCDLVASYRADFNRLTCTRYALSTAYALPKFAQLTVTSYYAASSASHYWISLLTRKIEEGHTSQTQKGKVK